MKRLLWQAIDRAAIFTAASRMAEPDGRDLRVEEALRLIESPDFFPPAPKPIAVEFGQGESFQFTSPRPGDYAVNNIVRGRLYRSGPEWRDRPAVILLHGWNDLLNHRFLFPKNAARLNADGINAATIELPWHFGRRPSELGAWGNFLSADIFRTLEAARQALSEIHALVDWLIAEGCPRVGVWGISMGGWLSGLSICRHPGIGFAVLAMPVARLDKVIDRARFCRTIRSALHGHRVDLGKLSLCSHQPVIARDNILLAEAQFDLFVDKDEIEELWRAWERPEILRLEQGHISVLWSRDYARRVEAWVLAKAGAGK